MIATGVPDRVSSITNIRRFYGRSVFHCPYCDGWELRDGPLAAYGRGDKGLRRALALREERVARLDGTRGQLHGGPGERRAHPAPRAVLQDRPRPDVALAADLGCRFAGKGHVRTDTLQGTHIDGLWVVGDASPDVKLAMLAAADGVRAAFAINEAFAEDETR